MNERLASGRRGALYLTIPTAGSHPRLLGDIVDTCGLPREHVLLIRTKPDVDLPSGCIVIDDFEEPNIQRWWKRGIDESAARGATAVAVLNDDLRIEKDTLQKLYSELVATGATVATPSRPGLRLGVHKRPLIPYEPVVWGCLWMVDATTDLRPDPHYVWWYGDNDLDIRARRDYAGIVSCDVVYEHHFPGVGTSKSPKLIRQSDLDAATFQADYSRLLTLSRWYRRLFKRRVETPPAKQHIGRLSQNQTGGNNPSEGGQHRIQDHNERDHQECDRNEGAPHGDPGQVGTHP